MWFCCWQRPCSLSKDDVKNISLFLKISEKELFEQYLVVDEIKRKLLILPRRVEQEDVAGEYLQFDRTYDIDSPCIFLDSNNLCKIHDVKSKQAKSFKCWEEESEEDDFAEWIEEDLINLGWSGLKDPIWDED
jgi:Fe-S-cluster containining protein